MIGRIANEKVGRWMAEKMIDVSCSQANYLIDVTLKIGYDIKKQKTFGRFRTFRRFELASQGLVILPTGVDPIRDELNLIFLQGSSPKGHPASINAFDDKASFAVLRDKRGTAISPFFEVIISG